MVTTVLNQRLQKTVLLVRLQILFQVNQKYALVTDSQGGSHANISYDVVKETWLICSMINKTKKDNNGGEF